jgi:hypothetical protein
MENLNLWLDIAADDLSSAIILYNNKKFRTSYFFFQQATEKANKVLALISGYLTEDDIYKVRHNQLKIYRKYIEKQEKNIREMLNRTEIHPGKNIFPINFSTYHKKLTNDLRFIDNLNNYNLIDLNYDILNSFIVEIQEFKQINYKLPIDDLVLNKKNLESILEWVKPFCNDQINCEIELILNTEKEKEKLLEAFKYIIPILKKIFCDLIPIMFTLYFCAIITIQHSSITRYPKENFNTLSKYSEELPIIQLQPKFMSLLEEAILKLRTLIQL